MEGHTYVQPWHHLHDRIAGILEFNASENIIEYLYKGALYSCDNLEYESDYCEFNRKCLYALAKIGTKESINYIKEVLKNGNDIVYEHQGEEYLAAQMDYTLGKILERHID